MSEAKELYVRYMDKDGLTWLVSTDGKKIWAQSEEGHRGMDGSLMRFNLTDGTQIALIGPWLSNKRAFEEFTGVKL